MMLLNNQCCGSHVISQVNICDVTDHGLSNGTSHVTLASLAEVLALLSCLPKKLVLLLQIVASQKWYHSKAPFALMPNLYLFRLWRYCGRNYELPKIKVR